ncbi:MAG: allantoate deiminase, partial [Eubacteriales bacterium]|nr:allantoate deiminase [Eubacteriales bacterium]
IVKEKIDWVSQFSHDPTGGLSRLLYKEDWLQTQNLIKDEMTKQGFKSEFDEVGNLFTRFEGELPETILIGSHIDTVVNGGPLDGQFGVLTGLIALEVLKEKYGKPKKSIEVVSMAEEEGSRFPFTFWGSKNIVGTPDRSEVEDLEDIDGVNFVAAMTQAGFNFKEEGKPARDDLEAYLEIHIEQGGILEREQKQIGVVTDIVGQKRYTVEVDGEANHAGTTPMSYRRDALAAAAEMIVFIHQTAIEFGDPMVATVGQIELVPNTSNVVPGKATFTIDFRNTRSEALDRFEEAITEGLKRIAKDYDVSVDLDRYMDGDPVPLDPNLAVKIEEYCKKNEIKYRVMHSGAGHDAQIFAPFVPTGLIFVPSIKGISHNPAEWTEPEDLAKGVEVMIGVIHELAY